MKKKNPSVDENALFAFLHPHVRHDLVSLGVPNSVAGSILNFFDPRKPEYLSNVDAWQRLLCVGASTYSFPVCFEQLFGIRRTCWGTTSIADADPWIIKVIQQVAKLVYKFHGKPRKETDFNEVKQRFVHPANLSLSTTDIEGIRSKLECLVPPNWCDLVGRFGPGVTADRKNNWQKWHRGGDKPRNVPPVVYSCNDEDMVDVTMRQIPIKYGITRVAEVPKSIKSNRLVSSEPGNFMFAQLAVGAALIEQLHTQFPQHVSLFDQEKHNKLLYKEGYCSIDLSDASDHVSRRLVSMLLPHWKKLLFSVRSTFTTSPAWGDDTVVPLRTFAPMGSGVCFPVLTAVVVGICRYVCEHPFHVYGDDVIVHASDFHAVCQYMTWCGLVVNQSKSCYNRLYRESCGLELFRDLDVTPVYFRDPIETLDMCAIEGLCQRLVRSQVPFLATERAVLQKWKEAHAPLQLRYNVALQRMEVLALVPTDRKVRVDGYDGLNRWFCVNSRTGYVSFPRRGESPLRRQWRSCNDFPLLVESVVHSDATFSSASKRKSSD